MIDIAQLTGGRWFYNDTHYSEYDMDTGEAITIPLSSREADITVLVDARLLEAATDDVLYSLNKMVKNYIRSKAGQ